MATLMRWDPFRDLISLQNDVERLAGGFGLPAARAEGTSAMTMPAWDVMTRGEDLVVKAELPGIKPENVEIEVTGDVMRISGEREQTSDVEERDYVLRESSYGMFERSLRLPETASVDDITADYRDGILEIVVPGAAPREPQTRRIEVRATQQLPEGGPH